MKNKDIDNFIREKAKEDQKISKRAEDVIKKFEKNVVLEGGEQMEKRVVTISFGKFVTIAASLVIVGFLGINLYAQSNGKMSAISSIQALFKNEARIDLDETAKSLFERAFYAVKETNIYEIDANEPKIYNKNNIVYVKTIKKYNRDELKERYNTIFDGEALDKIVDELFCDVDGMTYQIATSGKSYWIKNSKVENIKEEDEEITYKVTYEEECAETTKTKTCVMKIRKEDDGYKIVETEDLNVLGENSKQTEITEDTNSKEDEKITEDTAKNNTNGGSNDSNAIATNLCGDVNCDGIVNGKDLIALQKYLQGNKTLSEQGKENADTNDDGIVAEADVGILRQYLAGNCDRLPNRISKEKFITKDIPGMKINYPTSWKVTEINKNKWNSQPGEPSCSFSGTVNNVNVTLTVYEPTFNSGGYEELFRKECEKNGRQYSKEMSEGGFNIGSTDPNRLEWREATIANNTEVYYHVIDSTAGIAVKIEAKYDTMDESRLPALRVVEDMVLSAIITSY